MRLSPSRIFFLVNIGVIFTVFLKGSSSDAFRPDFQANSLGIRNGTEVSFRGRVCEEADVGVSNRRLTVCSGDSRVLVTTGLYPAHDYGDWLRITGGLQAPPPVEGFDYDSYLARYGIYSVMYYPEIAKEKGSSDFYQRAYRAMIRFKQHWRLVIDRHLAEPEAGLADAILLGYRRSVTREDLDDFARVGLSHLIAISGSHLTILCAFVLNLGLYTGLSRRHSNGAAYVFLAAYPLMTGLSASAVRAAIMGGLGLLAAGWGRTSSLMRALAFAAAAMLISNPRLLRDDIGFQLSFLAVLGLAYIYPLGRRLFFRKAGKRRSLIGRLLAGAADTALMTISAQLAVLPILLVSFQQISLVSPVANILVLWSFPPLLASLVLALVATAVIPALGQVWFFPAHLLLRYILAVTGFLARPEWAVRDIGGLGWVFGIAYYLAILGALIIFRKKKKPFPEGKGWFRG